MQNESNARILGEIAGALLCASVKRSNELKNMTNTEAAESFEKAMAKCGLTDDDAKKDALEGFCAGWGRTKGMQTGDGKYSC